MPRNARDVLPDYAHHVTQRGTDRQIVFRTAVDRRVSLDLMRESQDDAGVRILAFCLRTNHVHFVAVPEHGDSLAVLFRRVHGRYAQYFNARNGRAGHLWQARFHSCVLSPRHLEIALRYVEWNPVRAGMVSLPERYPWSSSASHLNEAPWDPMLDAGFWKARGGAEGWRLRTAQPQPGVLEHLLKRCTYSERPYGDSSFVAEVEGKLGKKWARWPYERELIDREMEKSLDALAPETLTAA